MFIDYLAVQTGEVILQPSDLVPMVVVVFLVTVILAWFHTAGVDTMFLVCIPAMLSQGVHLEVMNLINAVVVLWVTNILGNIFVICLAYKITGWVKKNLEKSLAAKGIHQYLEGSAQRQEREFPKMTMARLYTFNVVVFPTMFGFILWSSSRITLWTQIRYYLVSVTLKIVMFTILVGTMIMYRTNPYTQYLMWAFSTTTALCGIIFLFREILEIYIQVLRNLSVAVPVQ